MSISNSYFLRFDYKKSQMSIFANETAAINNKFTTKASKVRGVKLAIYKEKIVGMQFDPRKTTDYSIISKFLTDHLRVSENRAYTIMDELVGLSGNNSYPLSQTLH